MKKAVFFQALMLMVAFGLFLCACSKREHVDVVNGILPVRQLSAEHRAVLDDLRNVKPADRTSFIKRNWPNLSNDICSWLARTGAIKRGEQIRTVDYYYGSAKKTKGADRFGRIHDGYFNDELVAQVWVQGRKHPVQVAVRCLNGLFEIKGKFAALFRETPQTVFTIARREGLCDHVSYETAIDLAERFNLPLYRGRRMNERFRIAPAAARELSNRTAEIQVTVRVYPGDRFDLINMMYTPAGGREARYRRYKARRSA